MYTHAYVVVSPLGTAALRCSPRPTLYASIHPRPRSLVFHMPSGCQLVLATLKNRCESLLLFHTSSLCPPFSSPPLSFTHLRLRTYCAHFSTLIHSSLIGRPLMPPNPKHPDASKFCLSDHPYGSTGFSSSMLPVSATIRLPQVPGVAALYQKTEPQHLLLSTAAPVRTGITMPRIHARSNLYLAMRRPSDA